MLNIVQIHTDSKFIDEGMSRFESKFFRNTLIIFKGGRKYHGKHREIANVFKRNRKSIKKIIDICSNADLVVLFDLDEIKSYITNRLPKETKIAWRFFGHELYGRKTKTFLSKLTIEAIKNKWFFYLWQRLKRRLKKIKGYIKWGVDFEKEFKIALKRVDYFLCTSQEECNFLKKIWPGLPQFIRFPIINSIKAIAGNLDKRGLPVVVGHNKIVWNNHLELIEIIGNSNNRKKHNFLLLFSYGLENKYTRTVREKASGYPEIKFIEKFMSKEEFEVFYSQVSALVINTYRQAGLGNIFQAIKNGVKVYLNGKNIVLQWLKNERFLIFTIKDFANDIEDDNLALGKQEIIYNQKRLDNMLGKRSIEDFQKAIYDKINEF
ncbi:MAG: hypothetical protein PHU64_02025 [Candidatus Omnitrophica bacterium]|nr:hypothetical protein [Candidatus Omnitrophota bacterium]MDD5429605.1 hypothetical protein [Candidatus Omnitrophota bacterium]